MKNREIKPGMKFMIPVEIVRADANFVKVKLPSGSEGKMTTYPYEFAVSRFASFTPVGGWPKRRMVAGDKVRNSQNGYVWNVVTDENDAGEYIVRHGGTVLLIAPDGHYKAANWELIE